MTICGDTVSPARLYAALQAARRDLLGEAEAGGVWTGQLASSAVSTATAVSALSLVAKGIREYRARHPKDDSDNLGFSLETIDSWVSRGVEWLGEQQNPDGGWGDTNLSHSNIATTMLAVAAIGLSGASAERAAQLESANAYIDRLGRLDGLRQRYGKDKTFAVPILTNAALAGQADWADISSLPFEFACVPQSFYRFMQLPVVSYAIPALVAVGQARFHHRRPWNPIARFVRSMARVPSLRVLEKLQPASGGFLEATPLTSFVVMSLASIGQIESPVLREGVRFILGSAREDGSWPIDTNLATFNTSLAINALSNGGFDVATLPCLDWLLSCQNVARHPFTGAAPGGWGWTDLSGAVPDADDTPAALLALAVWRKAPSCRDEDRERIDNAAASGLRWMLDLQNRDGGWPTFCRGWGKLPFDRSGSDLTAHALRAAEAWRTKLSSLPKPMYGLSVTESELQQRAVRGQNYLRRQQQSDGHWAPLWFGNQDQSDEENPVYGTARVLLAYRDLGWNESKEAQRGYSWLASNQNKDGGWGGGVSHERERGTTSSVEETAVALEAFLSHPGGKHREIAENATRFLVETTESGGHRNCWPIGFYFAKLWYHERLYPLIFNVAALGLASAEKQNGDSPGGRTSSEK